MPLVQFSVRVSWPSFYSGTQCCHALDLECSVKAHMLKARVLACATVGRWWGLMTGTLIPGRHVLAGVQGPWPFLSLSLLLSIPPSFLSMLWSVLSHLHSLL